MAKEAPTYDLVLLLDPEVEDAARRKPLADARAAIEAQGELLRHDEWGSRALTYSINRRSAAEYHLLQFHAGSPELLRSLDRSLRIADEVLRFRIVKLKPGTPEAPDMRASATAPVRRAPAEPASQAEPAPAPEAAAEPASEAPVGEPEPAAEMAPSETPAEAAAEEAAAETG
jgi:small subunit ribosomal protein S6